MTACFLTRALSLTDNKLTIATIQVYLRLLSLSMRKPTRGYFLGAVLASLAVTGLGNRVQTHEQVLNIPDGQPIPELDLVVHEDEIKGWNLELKVTNFQFAPEKINQTSNITEGHAHLYVNGKKVTRIYSNWYYLSELEPGQNEIRVELNANGHESLMYQGQLVEDIEIVEVN